MSGSLPEASGAHTTWTPSHGQIGTAWSQLNVLRHSLHFMLLHPPFFSIITPHHGHSFADRIAQRVKLRSVAREREAAIAVIVASGSGLARATLGSSATTPPDDHANGVAQSGHASGRRPA